MPDCRDGGEVDVAGVGEDRALGQEPFETGRVFGAKAGQVIVAELVDDNGDNQFWFLSVSRRKAGGVEEHGSQDLSHAAYSVSPGGVGIVTDGAHGSARPFWRTTNAGLTPQRILSIRCPQNGHRRSWGAYTEFTAGFG